MNLGRDLCYMTCSSQWHRRVTGFITACNPELFRQSTSKLFGMHPIVSDEGRTPDVMASKKALGRSAASRAEKHVGYLWMKLLITDATSEKTPPPNSLACLKITQRHASKELSSDPWSRVPRAYVLKALVRSKALRKSVLGYGIMEFDGPQLMLVAIPCLPPLPELFLWWPR